MNKKRVLIGCIADDFTGASDIGSFFVKGGLKTLLINGIPEPSYHPDPSIRVIVIALKSRSVDKEIAIRQSLEAVEYFKSLDCRQLYFKYCSTFDSTPQGNIGPVTDALLNSTGAPYTILCPSLPVNGRKVRNGGLYVNDLPLHESPMKNHPVNPMWDYLISNLMEEQGQYSCFELSVEDMGKSREELKKVFRIYGDSISGKPFYIVPDYYEEEHGSLIASHFQDLPLITGGSGLAEHLARLHSEKKDSSSEKRKECSSGGRSVIFAGSCSTATREQIKRFVSDGGKSIILRADELAKGPAKIEKLKKLLEDPSSSEILIHTSGNGPETDDNDGRGMSQSEISELFENTMAELSAHALASGITRFISAGGETSGAITTRLNYKSFVLGESVAPGVPILTPVDSEEVRLVLKSGNFGQSDFFTRALRATEA